MNAATIFKTLTTVTLSITLLMTGGCNNMETKKEETGKNTAIENIFARKSVRAYTSQPIEKAKESVEDVMDDAKDQIEDKADEAARD